MKVFFITSIHSIFVDEYNEGEQENVNNYTLESTVEAVDYKEAVNKYLQENIGFNLDFNNCEVENDTIYTSCLVDSENMQPTQTELKEWESGNLRLYSNNITLLVSELVSVKF